jgi:hypothetical protein
LELLLEGKEKERKGKGKRKQQKKNGESQQVKTWNKIPRVGQKYRGWRHKRRKGQLRRNQDEPCGLATLGDAPV